jgi:hypothetical protein
LTDGGVTLTVMLPLIVPFTTSLNISLPEALQEYVQGRVPSGANALQHNLTLVTRNTKDVAIMGVSVFNPWTS